MFSRIKDLAQRREGAKFFIKELFIFPLQLCVMVFFSFCIFSQQQLTTK